MLGRIGGFVAKKLLPGGAAISSAAAARDAHDSGNNVELTASSIESAASVGLFTPAVVPSALALGGVQMARTINDAACETGMGFCDERLGPSFAGIVLFNRHGGGAVGALAADSGEAAELGSLHTPEVPTTASAAASAAAKVKK
ncbi:MAG: hypothetical protein R3D71_03015 [Rickettsiales bacterium]